MAGGLLVLFLGMYSWNQRTHTLDDIAANVGLEMSGTVLGTSRRPFKLMRVIDEESNIDKVKNMKQNYKKNC